MLPKLPQLLASFPALPLCCFLLRKILTKITNETSACCKLGHKVMERYLVTIRQQFPEKKLYSTFIQEQTVLLLSLPTIPNIIRQVKQVCVQNFVNKKYSSAVPQRKNCKHVTFCEARLLLLVGREASADQWNWDTKVEGRSWAELGWTLGLEGKHSLTRGTTRYFLPALFQISHAQRTD